MSRNSFETSIYTDEPSGGTETNFLPTVAWKLAGTTQGTGRKNKVIGGGIAIFFVLLIISLISFGFTLKNSSVFDQTTYSSRRSNGEAPQLKLAFVTNNASDFWIIARKGVEKADVELENVTVEFRMPGEGTAAQQNRIVDDLISRNVNGIAISPVDPENQIRMLNEAAKKTLVITQDSDAPSSDRAVYIGTDNVAAGRQAGILIKEALPKGGKIMVFVGVRDARNAKDRFQGIKEELEGSKVEIIGIRTDEADLVRAKKIVADTLAKYPKVAGLVGLWSYNGPAILRAVKDAKKVGKVKIIAFDEADETLAGIKTGAIFGTVVLQPFEFGYQSIIAMNKILNGDRSVIPPNKQINVPTLVIKKGNVEEFTKRLNGLKGK